MLCDIAGLKFAIKCYIVPPRCSIVSSQTPLWHHNTQLCQHEAASWCHALPWHSDVPHRHHNVLLFYHIVSIYIKVLSSVSTIVSCDMSEPLLHCDALFFHNNGQFCSGTHCLHITSLSYLRAALWHQIAQILTLLHCALKAPLWNHKAQYCHGDAVFLPW